VLAHIPVPQLTCLSAALAWRSTASNPSVCALADTVREIALVDPCWRDQASQPSQNALISGGSATLTGKKSGSIKRIAPPGRALATRFSTAIRASATW
jgi:hypothetical protein